MSPSRYAADTEVPVERSKRTIELLLQQHGADAYHTGWDSARDIIEFGWQGKQIRFVLPRPERRHFELSPGGLQRSRTQIDGAMEKADRQRWRALYLVVRAKLEAVEAGIAIFEEEFMAFIVIPGRNQTIGEILVPRIAEGSFDVSRALPEQATPVRLVRVFPRRTQATPADALAYVGEPDLYAEADAVHVSVTFTQDKPRAEQLAEKWARVAPVTVGGVAYGDASLEFIPGRYIKPGYTITSRGCPRRCWFCSVWKKWPEAHPLPIVDGWNVLDDNLLACPEAHVRAVFAMLRRQTRRVEFTGGLEALALQDYQVELLASLHPRPTMFWAYDPGDAFETLATAARKMLEAGFTAASHRLRCYVLIGYPHDTFAAALARLEQMVGIGLTPMAMLWQPELPSQEKWRPAPAWKRFQRQWARPALIHRIAAVDRPRRVFPLLEVGCGT